MQFNDDEFLLTPMEQKIFQDQRSMLQLRKIEKEQLRISVRVADEEIQKVRDEINANNEVLSQWQDITVSRTRETKLAEQIRRGVEAEVADAQKEGQPLAEMEPDLMQQLKNAENKCATTKNGLKASKEKIFADRGENEKTKSEIKKLEEENNGLLISTNNHSQQSAETQRLIKEIQHGTKNLQKKSNAEMEARIGELQQKIVRLSDEKVESDTKHDTKKPQIAELKNDIDKHQRDIREVQGHTFRLQEHYAKFRESQELFNRISNHDRILADVGNSPTMNHMIFGPANVQRVMNAISVEERVMLQDQARSRRASSEPIPRLVLRANRRNRNGLETRPGSSNQTSHQHGRAPRRFSEPAQGDRGTESTPPAPAIPRGTSSMANVPRGRRSFGPVARNPVRR